LLSAAARRSYKALASADCGRSNFFLAQHHSGRNQLAASGDTKGRFSTPKASALTKVPATIASR
jgi:hypothetical protein